MSVKSFPGGLIFDLDGTLVDSVPDIAGALNELMGLHGLAAHGVPAVMRMIGHGVPNLVERAFTAHGVTLDGGLLEAEVRTYLGLYEPRATRDTRLFPHVAETLALFAARNIPMAVCTNKPTAVSREIVASFGLSDLLPVVVGGDFGPPRKPAPDLLWKAAELIGVDPRQAVMIGDSGADVAAARAAEMPVIVVEYGYTSVAPADLGADRVIASFAELSAALGTLRETA
jgi:phosphoglycolate phosphatase